MSLLTYPKFQAPDVNGVNLAGGLVYFYEAGTTTPKDTYSDQALSVPNTNPVVLDARGEADIYLDGVYKIVLKTSDGTTIWTKDDAYGDDGQLRADLASTDTDDGTKGRNLVSIQPIAGETGIENHAFARRNVLRYIPFNLHAGIRAGTNTTILTTYIQNALDSWASMAGSSGAGKGAEGFFPNGGYNTDTLTWPLHVSIVGEETRLTTLFWAGSESSGSSLLSSSGQSFAAIKNISLFGWDVAGSGTDLVENLIRFESGALDLNFSIENVAFKGAKYNAIHQEAGQVVNFHLNRVRFDAIGGYGIRLKTFLGHESRPFSIQNWTLDNNNSALPSPYNAETKWGLGLLRVIDGGHNTSVGTFRFVNGRIEKNVKYKDTTYGDFTTGENIASIHLEGNAAAGGGQYSIDCINIAKTGSSNIVSDEALVTASGYSSSDAIKGIFRNIALANTTDTWAYKSNVGDEYNLPPVLTSMERKSSFERSIVRAKLSANQTGITTGGSPKVVNFNSEQIDSLGEFDITTNVGRFTPTRSGWYRVESILRLDAGVDQATVIAYILKNGSSVADFADSFSGTNAKSIGVGDIVSMNGSTDYLEIGVYHTTGVDRELVADATFVTIELMDY